jgi:glycosyltransferase involved in cell wall biosynthesis
VNILFFSATANAGYGGVSSWAHHLTATLQGMGHQVHVLTWGTAPFDAEAWGPHFHFRRLDRRILALPVVRFWYTYLSAARAGRRLLAEHDIQVIQAVHPYDAWAASLARRSGRAAIILSIHGDFPTEQRQRWKSRWRRRAYLPLENAAFRGCDLVTTSSSWLRGQLASSIGRTPAVVIPNAIVDLPGIPGTADRLALGLPEDRPVVLTLNNLYTFHRRQGLKLLIAATPAILERFPRAQFWVVGGVNNPARDRESLAWARREAGDLPFVFTGYRPVQPYDLLAAADVYVHPSFLDNSPTSVMEAMVLSKPIVATRVGGIPEIISHEETGLLVPLEPGPLAGAVVRLLADRAWACSLGERARAEALRSFTWSRIGEQFAALYEEARLHREPVQAHAHPRPEGKESQEESDVP